MPSSPWTDLYNNNTILKLHDKCPKCNCQNMLTFTPYEYRLEGSSIRTKLKKNI